jgi:tetratricopeptide (TPR) repeat protein
MQFLTTIFAMADTAVQFLTLLLTLAMTAGPALPASPGLGAVGQASAQPTAQRFDYLVRADFFAGVAGDAERLQKVIDLCEQTLAKDPRHAEAMVWHGAALLVRSGQAFQKGDMSKGGELWGRGIKEMDEAAAIGPDRPGVLITRGATLIEATKGMPAEMARPLLESAVANYELVLAIQEPFFADLSDHAKGELLFGVAEADSRLGAHEKARSYFERLIADAPSSGRTPQAREWLATGTVSKSTGLGCVGCHK